MVSVFQKLEMYFSSILHKPLSIRRNHSRSEYHELGYTHGAHSMSHPSRGSLRPRVVVGMRFKKGPE